MCFKNIKAKYILIFFSLIGFFCGVKIGFDSVLNENPDKLYDFKVILSYLFMGIVAMFGARNTTCILCNGGWYVKAVYLLFFLAILFGSGGLYSPISASVCFSTLLFIVVYGLLNRIHPKDDRECEAFLSRDK